MQNTRSILHSRWPNDAADRVPQDHVSVELNEHCQDMTDSTEQLCQAKVGQRHLALAVG